MCLGWKVSQQKPVISHKVSPSHCCWKTFCTLTSKSGRFLQKAALKEAVMAEMWLERSWSTKSFCVLPSKLRFSVKVLFSHPKTVLCTLPALALLSANKALFRLVLMRVAALNHLTVSSIIHAELPQSCREWEIGQHAVNPTVQQQQLICSQALIPAADRVRACLTLYHHTPPYHNRLQAVVSHTRR